MNFLRPRSLRWLLIQRIAIAQGIMVLVLSSLSLAAVSAMMLSGWVNNGVYDDNTIEALTEAVSRDASGKLLVANTAELVRLRAEVPNFWYVIEDKQGHRLSEGNMPAAIQQILPSLQSVIDARIGQDDVNQPPVGVLRWVETPDAGRIRMLTGAQGRVTLWKILRESTPAYQMAIYLATLMTLATVAVTPLVVRRALKGLDRIAHKVQEIELDRLGNHLDTDAVPLEVLPFVKAVNDAFARLDKGYEGHKRFLVDAAHELRTPIAILTTRLSALPPGTARSRLLEDSARLASLADQLLDLQRLDQQTVPFQNIDLVTLAERVVLDIAPLVFGGGYALNFEPARAPVLVCMDEMAVERAVINLIQNAISYGGRQGAISICVSSEGWIEVSDEGSGIPDHARAQIFEPFHRLKQDGGGVGLGLDLVQKVMQLHGGTASAVAGKVKGACFRLSFPVALAPAEN